MEEKIINRLLVLSIVILHFSCSVKPLQSIRAGNNNQEIFWKELNALCGKAFEGTVINSPANDTVFKGQRLIMHVRSCSQNVIRIPFMVGSNKSRTFVLSRIANTIRLKHDHRHEDGKEDSVTQYGGQAVNSGSTTLQVFPADQHTVNILPAGAATNIWWVELVPGKYFSYNVRRANTDRLFTFRFDLTIPVDIPEAPWGWKE